MKPRNKAANVQEQIAVRKASETGQLDQADQKALSGKVEQYSAQMDNLLKKVIEHNVELQRRLKDALVIAQASQLTGQTPELAQKLSGVTAISPDVQANVAKNMTTSQLRAVEMLKEAQVLASKQGTDLTKAKDIAENLSKPRRPGRS